MKFSRHQAIRDLLSASDDGMTIQEIADQLNAEHDSIRRAIKSIWGVYIDRWTVPNRGQYAAVYMCVEVPADVPHPAQRYTPQATWVSANASTS